MQSLHHSHFHGSVRTITSLYFCDSADRFYAVFKKEGRSVRGNRPAFTSIRLVFSVFTALFYSVGVINLQIVLQKL